MLADLGMDSLMGSEIQSILERNYGFVFSAQEIRGLTFGKLAELATGGQDGKKTPVQTSTTAGSSLAISSPVIYSYQVIIK